jgi:hypothetical protein
MLIEKLSKPRLLRRGGIFKLWSVGVFGDEVISLRVWGLMPEYIPNPMIIEVKTIIPHQRANTQDPNIENPWRGEGSC